MVNKDGTMTFLYEYRYNHLQNILFVVEYKKYMCSMI